MPLSPFYRETLESHVADINDMAGPTASSCKTPAFLYELVEKDTKWAHFDLAGISDRSFNSEMFGKEVSARSLPVFIEMLKRISN